MFKKSIILLATLVAAAGLCLAQDQTATKPAEKQTAIKQTSPASGKEMFAAYCAPCHGAAFCLHFFDLVFFAVLRSQGVAETPAGW
jgi:mono/diheme cytochrome c family protein